VTGYLLDTNVISAFAPDRAAVEPNLSGWLEARSDQLFLSVVSIVEIEAGIRKLHRIGSTVRAKALGAWIDGLQENYSERILAFDLGAARIAGAITDRTRAAGASPGFADIAIAATAEANDVLLLTANARHFEFTGVRYANPFEALPR
jgi:predicted nucleic acid-binding protein